MRIFSNMSTDDFALIELTEASLKAMDVTVCFLSLDGEKDANFVIHTASAIKRRNPLVLDVVPQACYQVFKKNDMHSKPDQSEVIRDQQLLQSIARDLDLPKPLRSALQVPLIIEEKLIGFLVFGEMRNWGRGPITKTMVQLAQEKARKIEAYLIRKNLL